MYQLFMSWLTKDVCFFLKLFEISEVCNQIICFHHTAFLSLDSVTASRGLHFFSMMSKMHSIIARCLCIHRIAWIPKKIGRAMYSVYPPIRPSVINKRKTEKFLGFFFYIFPKLMNMMNARFTRSRKDPVSNTERAFFLFKTLFKSGVGGVGA